MSIPPPVTVVLANRPRLFRELLHHALKTASPQFRVVEAADAMPSTAVLKDAHWLVVDEDTAPEAAKLATTYPALGILALDGRGNRARVLASAANSDQHSLSDVPTLSQLFSLLSHESAISTSNTAN